MPASQALAEKRPDHRDRFVGFAFAAADLLAEIDQDRRLTFAAGAYRERFAADPESFCGCHIDTLIAPEDHGGLEIALSLLAARGRLTPMALHLNDVARTEVSLSGLCLRDKNGIAWLTLARMPSHGMETTVLAAAPLFRQAMGQRLAQSGGCGVGLIEVGNWNELDDIDRRALETGIAGVLRDAGGSGAMAAEIAAGRFGVLGDGPIDMAELQASIARILRAAGVPPRVSGTAIPLAIEGLQPAQAMRAMRFALARFASSGTAGVRDTGVQNGLRHFLDVTEAQAAAVRRAIEASRFRLTFQPVANLATRQVHHFEALLRPFPIIGHEINNTQEFVNFAEAMGLAEVLDTAVLARAANALRGGQANIAINVSGLSLQSPDFREKLLQFTSTNPDIAPRLLIEITETADIEDVPAAVETVNQLCASGVRMCLDDFGAGFAAFRYLREFQVDFVKIDGSYVRQVRSGARESGFIGAMVELARCVGARAIAEMVETEDEAARVAALGVQFGQGWLFGKPGTLPGSL